MGRHEQSRTWTLHDAYVGQAIIGLMIGELLCAQQKGGSSGFTKAELAKEAPQLRRRSHSRKGEAGMSILEKALRPRTRKEFNDRVRSLKHDTDREVMAAMVVILQHSTPHRQGGPWQIPKRWQDEVMFEAAERIGDMT